ncbi:MAG: serine/threonine-protein kinase [Lysobacterales bacterium]
MAFPDIPGYQLLRQIGSGGMATVYLALQMSLERKVAIKVLRTSSDDDPERTEKRFLREGRTLAKITHKNVCGIYDIAKVGDVAYIAMEYLDGGTLVDKLKSGLSVSEAIAVVVQVASALEEAHKLGIIHRDLKPANVMLRGGRVPVLTDFGIARELTAAHTRITAENMIVGTPIYMSPEQVSGGEVDGRSDLYALGVMFYELLTGQPPYKGDTPIAVCMQHLTAAIPQLPPDLKDLQPVIERLLAKRREDRYESMAAFTHALRDVFVNSDSLRRVLRFSPDTPWSEQLRDLGFSFDTLRDADVKAALEGQRSKSRAAPAKPAKPRPAAPRQGGRRIWMAVAAVLIAVAAAGGVGWWAWQKRAPAALDETTLLALNALQSEFFTRLQGGDLFAPKGASALDTARRMRKISTESSYTAQAFEALRKAAVARVRDALAAGNLEAADAALASINRFQNDLQVDELTALQAERASVAQSLASAQAVQQKRDRLQQLVDGAAPASGESVLALYVELARSLGSDPAFQALMPKAEAAARIEIENRLAAGDLVRARKDVRELAAVRASAAVTALQQRVEEEAAGAELAALIDRHRALLSAPVTAASLDQLLANLTALQSAGQGSAEHAAARADVATAVDRAAQQLAAQEDFDGALALLAQAQRGLGSQPALSAREAAIGQARERRLAEQRAAAEAARQGQLVVSAAPWATVQEVVDGSGQRVALPGDASTPLRLTLSEGSYRVTVSQANGERRQQSVQVTRGQIAQLKLSFSGYGADEYLREVGW